MIERGGVEVGVKLVLELAMRLYVINPCITLPQKGGTSNLIHPSVLLVTL